MTVSPIPARSPDYFLDRLSTLHARMRDRLYTLVSETAIAQLSTATEAREGDTIFLLDERGEEVVDDFFQEWGSEVPLLVVAEGHPGDGGRTYPAGTPRHQVAFTCIVDPIDGTRGLMYGKRSAWLLTGIAPPPHFHKLPTLDTISIAMQTELPTTRAFLSDRLWAVTDGGAHGETYNLLDDDRRAFTPHPSGADSLLYGFSTICKFFPGTKAAAVDIEERLFGELLEPSEDGNPRVFDDEYISSGGQLYELMMGHDRFIADLRPLLQEIAGVPLADRRLCAHPYDLCTELIAREAGVMVTDERGKRLRNSLDIRTSCTWIGYANRGLRETIEPVLLRILEDRTRHSSR